MAVWALAPGGLGEGGCEEGLGWKAWAMAGGEYTPHVGEAPAIEAGRAAAKACSMEAKRVSR